MCKPPDPSNRVLQVQQEGNNLFSTCLIVHKMYQASAVLYGYAVSHMSVELVLH